MVPANKSYEKHSLFLVIKNQHKKYKAEKMDMNKRSVHEISIRELRKRKPILSTVFRFLPLKEEIHR